MMRMRVVLLKNKGLKQFLRILQGLMMQVLFIYPRMGSSYILAIVDIIALLFFQLTNRRENSILLNIHQRKANGQGTSPLIQRGNILLSQTNTVEIWFFLNGMRKLGN